MTSYWHVIPLWMSLKKHYVAFFIIICVICESVLGQHTGWWFFIWDMLCFYVLYKWVNAMCCLFELSVFGCIQKYIFCSQIGKYNYSISCWELDDKIHNNELIHWILKCVVLWEIIIQHNHFSAKTKINIFPKSKWFL